VPRGQWWSVRGSNSQSRTSYCPPYFPSLVRCDTLRLFARFGKNTVNRNDLKQMALVRLREARALFQGGNYDGAYYLSGYAIECALKACIAKKTKRYDFPDKRRANDSYTHSLTQLVRVAELQSDLDQEISNDVAFGLK
jgi:HEPN domain-containing protein